MTKMEKIIVSSVILLLVGLVIWTVRSLPEISTADKPLEKKIMTYGGNSISAERDGQLLWEVKAENMEIDLDTQDADITNMVAVFYHMDGRQVTLLAPKAKYFAKEKNIRATGGIEGHSTDGMKLICEKMEWNSAQDLLVLEGKVSLEREEDKLKAQGDRVESQDGFSRFKIIGNGHVEKGYHR